MKNRVMRSESGVRLRMFKGAAQRFFYMMQCLWLVTFCILVSESGTVLRTMLAGSLVAAALVAVLASAGTAAGAEWDV